MSPERINIITNIKAIGWTSMILFTMVAYYSMSQLLVVLIFNQTNPFFSTLGDGEYAREFYDTYRQMVLIYIMGCLAIFPFLIGAYGVIQFRRWGWVIHQLGSILIVVGLVGFVGYGLYVAHFQVDSGSGEVAQYAKRIQYYQVLATGLPALGIAWLVTKVSLLFLKRDYQKEFS